MVNLRKLGRGLDSLMSDTIESAGNGKSRQIEEIELSRISPNPGQPRRAFDPEKINELSESIKSHGILQPIVVRSQPGTMNYEIIAGERRWRAASTAGLKTVPVIVLNDVDQRKLLELSLIENIQREDLNPIEKAKGYKALIEDFLLTQEAVAQQVGQNRATVANMIRLLELPPDIQDSVSRGTLSMGHARALLALENHSQQRTLAAKVLREGLSVRDVEKKVGQILNRGQSTIPDVPGIRKEKPPHIKDFEERIIRAIGCRTEIQLTNDTTGRLVIEFANNEDFERVLQCLGISVSG